MLRRGLEDAPANSYTYPQRRSQKKPRVKGSVHLSDELVDVRLPVTKVTTLDEVLELACPPATVGVGELEGPQEVRCLGRWLDLHICDPAISD